MSRTLCLLSLLACACSGGGNSPTDGGPQCTTIDGVCLNAPLAVATRTQCGDVTDFCDKSGMPPQLSCLTTPKVPGAGPAMVTLTGFIDVFSNGPNANGISVAVYDAVPLLGGQDISTATPIAQLASVVLDPATQRACDADGKFGCSLPSHTGCTLPVCNDGLDGRADSTKYCRDNGGNFVCSDRLRWEARYTLPVMVPTNKPLVVRVTGANGLPDQNWANLVVWNVFLSTSDHACVGLEDNDCIDVAKTTYQLNVNALSKTDYVNIPVTSGLSGGIAVGRGAVAGEVHDCDNVRLENVVVGMNPIAERSSYFNGNPIKTLPDSSRVATDRLGLFTGLNLPPGKVTVVAAGLTSVGGPLVPFGTYAGYIYPDTVSVINLNEGHPKQ